MRPDFYTNFPSLKIEEEAKEKGATEEERNYYSMALTLGWKQFEEEVERLLEELDSLNDNAVSNGMPYEEIGKNTIVVSLTKGIIRKLINRINDAKEACERGEGE